MADYTRVFRLNTNKNDGSSRKRTATTTVVTFATLFVALSVVAVANAAAAASPSAADQRGGPNEALLDAMLRGQQQQQQQQQSWPLVDENGPTGIYYEPTEIDAERMGVMPDFPAANQLDGLTFDGQMGGIDPAAIQQDFGGNSDAVSATDDDQDSSFFELSPEIGQTAGLALNKDDHLVLFHRSARVWNENSFGADNRLNRSLGVIPNATIAVLDPQTGKLLAEHGAAQFYMPHGLTIDADGNYWLTDVGSHQVIKLDKNFKTVMELGEKLVPGTDEKHFCKPTDVAVAKNGDFFVADGYCNSRIMKFNKDGKYITSFGAANSEEPPLVGEFFVPHSLALIEDLNLLCVADRENKRIQCFAAGLTEAGHYHPRAFVPTGTFFTKAENIGRVYAIREKHHYLVGVTNHDESGQVEPQVFVMDMNTGRANTFAKGLENAHALALSDQGDIYISQINPNQIVKFSVPDQI